MGIACEKCIQRERIIGELEDENKRLGAKIVILKDNNRECQESAKQAKFEIKHMSISEAMSDGY